MKRLFAALLFLPLFAACSEDEGAARGWDPEINGAKSCAPATCESLAKTCGTHEDGCGGTIECGEACVDSACVPRTCQDLSKTCGKHDDSCGGMVDCGPCNGCAPDARESNNSPDKATDLGALTDHPDSTTAAAGLTAADGDEDWFTFAVSDSGFGGNPQIKASVSGTGLEVSVFYLCDADTNYSSCPIEGEKEDATIGKGCSGSGTATLDTSCSWWNETGKAYVRVRKMGAPDVPQCLSYALNITVI